MPEMTEAQLNHIHEGDRPVQGSEYVDAMKERQKKDGETKQKLKCKRFSPTRLSYLDNWRTDVQRLRSVRLSGPY